MDVFDSHHMRLLPLLAIAAVLAGCGASEEPAAAPTPAPAPPSPVTVLGVAATVEPARAGTPAAPQGVTLDLALELAAPEDVEPPLASATDVTLPAALALLGERAWWR